VALDELSPSGESVGSPIPSPDELTLYYYNLGQSRATPRHISVATRKSARDKFSGFHLVPELESEDRQDFDVPKWVSPDGCHIYFDSMRRGGSPNSDTTIWYAERPL
jgi:hypothetical protein